MSDRKRIGDPKSNLPTPKPKSADSTRQAIMSASYYVEQLAIQMGVEITKERLLLYVRGLSDLSVDQLKHGFERAAKEFVPGYGINFPYIGVLRGWCLSYTPPDNTQAILERGDKPDDLTDEERREYSEKLTTMLHENIKAGKWAMPTKGYVQYAEELASERIVKSEIPKDPEERRQWARQKEKEQGWR